MADPVSIAFKSAGTAFIICKATYDLVDGMKKAPEEIRRVAADMRGLYSVLGAISHSIGSHRDTLQVHGSAAYHIENLTLLIAEAIIVFRDVHQRLQNFTTKDGQVKKSGWGKGRFQWEMSEKEEIRQTRLQLSNITSTLSLALNALALEWTLSASSANTPHATDSARGKVSHLHDEAASQPNEEVVSQTKEEVVSRIDKDIRQLRDGLQVARQSRVPPGANRDRRTSRWSLPSDMSGTSHDTTISMEETMMDFATRIEVFVSSIHKESAVERRAGDRRVPSPSKSSLDSTLEALEGHSLVNGSSAVQVNATDQQQLAKQITGLRMMIALLDLVREQMSGLVIPGHAPLPPGYAIDLSGRRLRTIPSEVIAIVKDTIVFIQISRNPHIRIPPEIVNCECLTSLDIRECQLDAFPEAILNLCRLQILELSYNQLPSIPDRIVNLTSLYALGLTDNKITRLPLTLSRMANLIQLNVVGNPLSFPSSEVLGLGTSRIPPPEEDREARIAEESRVCHLAKEFLHRAAASGQV